MIQITEGWRREGRGSEGKRGEDGREMGGGGVKERGRRINSVINGNKCTKRMFYKISTNLGRE